MTPGQVGKIREMKRGVEAEVCVGATGKYGYTVLKVTGNSPRIQAAMANLRDAFREEANEQLIAAQKDQIIRTGDAIGVE